MKTEDLVKKMRFARKAQNEDEAQIFEDTLQHLVVPMCEAGLVDNVEPTGAIIPIVPWTCTRCGDLSTDEDASPCKRCGGSIWSI